MFRITSGRTDNRLQETREGDPEMQTVGREPGDNDQKRDIVMEEEEE